MNSRVEKRVAGGMVAALVGLALSACTSDASGGQAREVIQREVGKLVPFDVVELRGPFKADVRVGSGPDLKIEGPTYLIEALDERLADDKLVLSVPEDLDVDDDDRVTVGIDTPALKALGLAGLSKTTVQAPVGEALAVSVSGASTLELRDVNVQQLTLEVSGAADVTAAGTASEAVYSLSGAGAFKAQDLVAKTVRVNLSGAGSVRVHATESVSGAVAGIGKLSVTGNPAARAVAVSGVGDVVYE